MPITLAEAARNAQDALDLRVIDEFRKTSWLLDNLVFDPAVNPSGGGGTLTYGYRRLVTERGADFRALNSEYTPGQAVTVRETVDLAPLGGKYQLDRVLGAYGAAVTGAIRVQQQELVKSTVAKFQTEFIFGDTAVNANGFDGLDKALTGSSTEIGTGTVLDTGQDWTAVATEAAAIQAMEWMDLLQDAMNSMPSAFLTNRDGKRRLRQLGRWAKYYSRSEDAFGRLVEQFNDIPIIDLGERPGTTDPIIPIETRDLDGAGGNAAITGLTDVYAVTLDESNLHAVTMAGRPLLQQWLPDFTTSGAVKDGEVEMGPVAMVLRRTKGAAVLRNIKVV
jgi:hypothetical protein